MGSSLLDLDPLRAYRNQSPVPFVSRAARSLGGLLTRPAGQEAQQRAQGSNGTLFAIVDRIITSYSQVDWHLYRKARSGLKSDRVEVTSHAALDLWNKPNPFVHGMAYREATQQHEELTGEQWTVIAKTPGVMLPLELWDVRPDRMRPVADPEKFIVGYEYIGPSGEIVPLGLDEVIFQRRPNPLDPYRGLGPVQTILTDLDSSRYSREWNRQFFLNDASPGGILKVDKRLSDEEFNEHRDRWAEQHRGVSAAHRVALLENGITWIDRKYTNRDMQFAELAAASRETIREAFGFPKPTLGAVDNVNRANADAADLLFTRWLIVPRLKRTRAALNMILLPMYGPGARDLEFDFDSPVPEDLEAEAAQLTSKATAAKALRDAGYDPADVLTTVGLPPMRHTTTATPAAPASFADAVSGLLRNAAATTWKARAHEDVDICKPCSDNDGHEYPTQAAAYADYPGGKGYVHCLGTSNCRCTVVEET
jgi:HK97 family phage portal protein